MKKAVFITLEGLEGCGKSSVMRFLTGLFKKNNLKIQVYRDPGSTEIGEKIRNILLDRKNTRLCPHTELLLYLAARSQLIGEKLKKDLFKYDLIICDRFYDSTLVYQGYALGIGKLAGKSVDIFSSAVKPDLTLFLDVAAEKGLRRLREKDRIESRPLDYHRKLRKGFLKLARKEPKRIKIIDASGKLTNVYRQVEETLAKAKQVPIKKS